MKCPHCNADGHHRVTRSKKENGAVKRSRRCHACQNTFHTREEPARLKLGDPQTAVPGP